MAKVAASAQDSARRLSLPAWLTPAGAVAVSTALLTLLLLWAGHTRQGISAWESSAMEQAALTEAWLRGPAEGRGATLAAAWEGAPASLLRVGMAVTHLLSASPGRAGPTPLTGWRLSGWLWSALLSWVLVRWTIGSDIARGWRGWQAYTAGALAAALFWLTPTTAFLGREAGGVSAVVALGGLWLLAYRRWLRRGRGALLCGVLFGAALLAGRGALLLPLAALLHAALTEQVDLRAAGLRGLAARVPRPLWAMALLGPLLLWAGSPAMWRAPVSGLWGWLAGSGGRPSQGELAPASLLAMPPATLLLLVLAAVTALFSALAWLRGRRGEASLSRADALLLVVAVVGLVSGRRGAEAWTLTLALASSGGALLLVAAGAALAPWRPVGVGLLAAMVLLPALAATSRRADQGAAAAGPLVGDAVGAAARGLSTAGGAEAIAETFAWLTVHADKEDTVYLHGLGAQAFAAWQGAGLLRADLQRAESPEESRWAVYPVRPRPAVDPERTPLGAQLQAATAYGALAPAWVARRDGVPVAVVHLRPD